MLEERWIKVDLITLSQIVYKNNKIRINSLQKTENSTEAKGCVLTPLLFSIVVDEGTRKGEESVKA